MNPRSLIPAATISGSFLLTHAAALAAAPPKPDTLPAPRAPAGGREVDLRPKFRVGRDTTYQFDLTSANSLKSPTTPELDGDQTMTQSIWLKVHPVEVNDEGASVEMVYERIKATFETKELKGIFDSTLAATPTPVAGTPTKPAPRPSKPAPGATRPTPKSVEDRDTDDLLAQIMRPMVGTRLTLHLDKQGNIKSVSGGDALTGGGLTGLEGLLGGLGGLGALGGSSFPGLNIPTGGAGPAAGPAAWVINNPGQHSIVHVGETWTNNDSLAGTPVGGFSMVTRHTCRSATEAAASLSFNGRADAKSLSQPGAAGGFQLKESSYDGTYTWDLARGELKDFTSTMTTTVEQPSGKDAATQLKAQTKVTVRRSGSLP